MPQARTRQPRADRRRRPPAGRTAAGDRPHFRAEPLEPRLLLATVSGAKFNDADADGVRGREGGLAGWTIYYDADNDGQLDASEPRDVTDALGRYSFDFSFGIRLSAVIREVPQPGWRPTAPADGSHTLTGRGPDDVFTDVDFGNTRRVVVTGSKFDDANANGRFDLFERGAGGWTIYADANGNGQYDSASEVGQVTDDAGAYRLVLPESAAAYTIREVPQVGWRQTFPADGAHEVPGAPGSVADGRNFLNTSRTVVTGVAFHDRDADGTPDAGEEALAAWTVFGDLDDDGVLDAGESSDTTAADGTYRLLVPSGPGVIVRVREVPRTDWRVSRPTAGYYFAGPDFTPGILENRDFGNTQGGLVIGVKFNDLDSDGKFDADEPTLSEFTVFADLNNTASLDPDEPTDVTDAQGRYSLGIPEGKTFVAVLELEQPGWRLTTGGLALSFDQPAQQQVFNVGNTRRPLIAGAVFEDTDGDGSGRGEPELDGWTVYLDFNDNARLDGDEPSTETVFGRYSLVAPASVLPIPRTYVVRIVPQAGWLPTVSVAWEREVEAGWGARLFSVDFGLSRPATVRGRKFLDFDADGVDDGELGLANWLIYEDANNDGTYQSADDPRNFHDARDLPLGTRNGATVRSRIEVAGAAPLLTDLDVTLSITHPTVSELSAWLISPRGTRVRLFSDVGGNSDDLLLVGFDDEADTAVTSADPPLRLDDYRPEQALSAFDGENPNGQWTLEVADAAGADAGEITTFRLGIRDTELADRTAALGGAYSIGGVTAGTRVIREELQPGWVPTLPPTGARSVLVHSGETVTGQAFGNAQPGSISGIKFDDQNGDGTRNPGERPMAGFTIYRDLNNNGRLETFTAERITPGPQPLFNALVIAGFTVPANSSSFRELSALPGLVVDVNVTVSITHPRVSDLQVYLISPTGQFSLLADRPGGAGAAGADMLDTTFDDQAGAPLSGAAPFTGTFRPVTPLSNLDSSEVNGRWELRVYDYAPESANPPFPAPFAEGTLNSWTLHLTDGDPRRVTGADGAYAFNNLMPGRTYVVREAEQPGWVPTAPIGGAYELRLNSGQDATGRDFGNRAAPPSVTAVYARGSTWAGDDGQPGNVTFKEYLQARGLGDSTYGYRLSAGDTIPWVNVNQVVLRYDSTLPLSPLPASVTLDGVRSDYTATPTILDPQAVLLTLDRPLGSLPAGGENGDRIRLSVNLFGENLELAFNVLQGDVDRSGTVVAADFSDVKKKFFRTATNPGPAGDAQYTPYHDVDGSGSIVAGDFSEVKKRFFDSLPPAPAATTSRRGGGITSDLLGGGSVL